MSQATIGPRAYLKKAGLQFDKSPDALDRAFLNSFAPEKRELVADTWRKEVAWENCTAG